MAKEFVSLERLNLFLTKVKGLINQKADKSQTTLSTLQASNWSGSTYSFEATYPASDYDLEVGPDSTCSAAQLSAYNDANIVGSSASNVLTAFGTVPTVDIPIFIKVVSK